MKMEDIVQFAYNNIKKKKTQSIITMIGIIIGVFSIVSLISLGYGVQEYTKNKMMKLGSNTLTILPFKQFGMPPSNTFNDKTIKTIKNMKEIKSVVYGWYASTEITYNKEKKYVYYFYGKPRDIQKVYLNSGYSLESGRWLSDNDRYKCVIGYWIAHKLFNREISIGDSITINGKKFKVVGILNQIGNQQDDNTIIIPLSTGEEIFNKHGVYNFIMVVVKDNEDVDKVSKILEKKLKKILGNDDFSILSAKQLANTIGGILGVLTLFVVGVAGISIVVGAVGISNTTHMSILQRKKDIGILKALGAETKDILLIFVVESGFLGLFGGIVGIVLGIVGAKIVEIIAHNMGYLMVNAWISPELILGALLFSFIIGVISGYFPARSGAKLNPIDTLRGE